MVTYWYPNDVIIDFSSGQFVHAFEDLCTRLHCTTGSIDTHYGGEVVVEGTSEAYRPGATTAIYQEGAVANIQAFHAAIAAGKPINNAQESAHSTLTGVLGRMAAYQGRTTPGKRWWPTAGGQPEPVAGGAAVPVRTKHRTHRATAPVGPVWFRLPAANARAAICS